jgi:hypothetical protein
VKQPGRHTSAFPVLVLWKFTGAHGRKSCLRAITHTAGCLQNRINGSQKEFFEIHFIPPELYEQFLILHTSFVIDRILNREYSHFTLSEHFQPEATTIHPQKIFPPPRVDASEQT